MSLYIDKRNIIGAGLEKNLKSSLFFAQAAVTFCLTGSDKRYREGGELTL